MGFLAPWFLAGIAVVGLPLWLHLLRRHKSEPKLFSSLMFFEPRAQSSVRHRRFLYLLLLALRVALLLLLAFAFANPFINVPSAAGNTNRLLVLAIDRSFSMRYADHLQRARQMARDTLAKWPSSAQAQVLVLDSQAEFLTRPLTDRVQLQTAIDQVQAGDEGTSYAALVRALRGARTSLQRPLEVHLFSDFQKTAMPAAFADLQLPPDTVLVREPVASDAGPNWAVESVSAPNRLFDAKKRRVTALIAGYNTPAARRTVALLLDNRTLETKTVDVPASGRATVEFQSLESPYGLHRGEVRIDSADRLPEDDRFALAIERAEPRPILFLYPGNRARVSFYFQHALEASGTSGFTLEPVSLEQAGSLNLSRYAVVVLSDTGPIGSLEQKLHSYVSGGGGLLIAVGPSSLMSGRVPVTGHSISGDPRTRGAESGTLPGVALDQVRFYSSLQVDPGKSTVVGRFSNGAPLLVEDRVGSGRVAVFASGLDNVSNDFPLHPSFVPFVERVTRELAGLEESSMNTAVGASLDLHRAGDTAAALDITGPDGKRALSLEQSASVPSLRLAREGFYEIHGPNGIGRLIAVHAPRTESDLTRVTDENLDLWAKSGATGGNAGTSNANRDPESRSYGRYALALALMLALAESVVSIRYLWQKGLA